MSLLIGPVQSKISDFWPVSFGLSLENFLFFRVQMATCQSISELRKSKGLLDRFSLGIELVSLDCEWSEALKWA